MRLAFWRKPAPEYVIATTPGGIQFSLEIRTGNWFMNGKPVAEQMVQIGLGYSTMARMKRVTV